MNPFTKFLGQWAADPHLDEFVAYWDRLEKLTILVYREKMPAAEAETEFNVVWPWLREQYGRWAGALKPFWQQTTAAGQPTQADPFRLILEKQSPADIPGDWRTLQHLPAAREALNQYLLAKS